MAGGWNFPLVDCITIAGNRPHRKFISQKWQFRAESVFQRSSARSAVQYDPWPVSKYGRGQWRAWIHHTKRIKSSKPSSKQAAGRALHHRNWRRRHLSWRGCSDRYLMEGNRGSGDYEVNSKKASGMDYGGERRDTQGISDQLVRRKDNAIPASVKSAAPQCRRRDFAGSSRKPWANSLLPAKDHSTRNLRTDTAVHAENACKRRLLLAALLSWTRLWKKHELLSVTINGCAEKGDSLLYCEWMLQKMRPSRPYIPVSQCAKVLG